MCSSSVRGVDRRISIPDVITMRRAVGMDPHLPSEQTRWLLDETERLLRERQELQHVVARLEDPWRDVRSTMNQIAAVLRQRD
jgi:hypothetical protein